MNKKLKLVYYSLWLVLGLTVGLSQGLKAYQNAESPVDKIRTYLSVGYVINLKPVEPYRIELDSPGLCTLVADGKEVDLRPGYNLFEERSESKWKGLDCNNVAVRISSMSGNPITQVKDPFPDATFFGVFWILLFLAVGLFIDLLLKFGRKLMEERRMAK